MSDVIKSAKNPRRISPILTEPSQYSLYQLPGVRSSNHLENYSSIQSTQPARKKFKPHCDEVAPSKQTDLKTCDEPFRRQTRSSTQRKATGGEFSHQESPEFFDQTFHCKYDHCQKTFTNYFNLRRHVMLKHTEIRPFKCHLCTKKFALLQYFQEHLLVHMPLREAQRLALTVNPSILESLPVFFVEQCSGEDDLLSAYIEAKPLPNFIYDGVLPTPEN